MANFEQAKEALLDFLKEDTFGECLILRGQWGSGKTYLWETCSDEGIREGWLNKEKVKYVSLYGLGSADEIAERIRSPKAKIHDPFHDKTNDISLSDVGGIADFGIGSSLNGTAIAALAQKTIRGGVNKHKSRSARSAICCFDDLDRITHEDGSATRFFGFINYMKNELQCKVILIVNDEIPYATNGAHPPDYREHFEKLGNRQIHLKNSPEKGVSIVFGVDKRWNFLQDIVNSLEIYNIRNIQRIQYFGKYFKKNKHINDDSSSVVLQSIFSGIALAIKCLTDRNFIQPKVALKLLDDDTIIQYRNMSGAIEMLLDSGDEPRAATLKEQFLGKVIERLGDTATLPIFRGAFQYVCEGVIDKDAFKKLTTLADEEVKIGVESADAFNSFQSWWSQTYHGSIQTDGALAMANLSTSLNELANVDFANVGLGDLNSSIVMLRKHGPEGSADNICKKLKDFLQTDKGKKYLQDKLRLWGVSSVTDSEFQNIIDELGSKSLDEIENEDLIWQIFEGKESSEHWKRINSIPKIDILKCLAQDKNPTGGEEVNIEQRIYRLLFFPAQKSAAVDFAREMLSALDSLAKDSFARERIERFGANRLNEMIKTHSFEPKNLFQP